MTRLSTCDILQRRAHSLALAIILAATAAVPSTARAAAAVVSATPRDATAIDLTAADVAASNAKVRDAFRDLVQTWGSAFAEIGTRFAAPSLVRYRGAVRSPCGVMRPGNAGYCGEDNTIYYDELFVAAQAKSAAQELGTDGDMAAVGVIAHEMGHAVAMQLGHMSRYPYRNEQTADCLAGAFARIANARGQLDPGDVDEAYYGMASAGDPSPRLTGDDRVDHAIVMRASVMGHGSDQQRMANFRAGLSQGAGACLPEFR